MATAIFSPYKANEGGVAAYHRDASFSSYLDTTERDFVRSLAESINNPSPTREIPTLRKHVGRNVSRAQRSGELGVYGAERYFNETIKSDSPPSRKVNGDEGSARHRHHRGDKYKRDDSLERKSSRSNTTTSSSLKSPTPSLKSQGNFNNQIGLLLPKKGLFVGHKIFSGFQCKGSCFDKKSIHTTNTHQKVQPSPKSYQRNGNGHTKDRLAHQEHFAFPIIDTASLSLDHDKSNNDSMDVFGFHQLKNQEKEQNFNTKFSIIAWNALPNSNMNTPFLAFPLRNKTSPCNEGDEDACSDASSDLFEIENLSGVHHHDIQTSSPYHEPSEGSIEWSIATASEADNVSCLSDDDHKTSITIERRKAHNKSSTSGGIFLGCTNHKAVDIIVGN